MPRLLMSALGSCKARIGDEVSPYRSRKSLLVGRSDDRFDHLRGCNSVSLADIHKRAPELGLTPSAGPAPWSAHAPKLLNGITQQRSSSISPNLGPRSPR